MEELILNHVGSRIRLYRKSSGMTMAELAQKVNKTKSSISKYESGQTAIDIVTLLYIASALGITLSQLVDIPATHDPITSSEKSIYIQSGHLYLYHMYREDICFSKIDLGAVDGIGQTATMFYKINDSKNQDSCECIYHGHVFSHSTVLSLSFCNYYNPIETILLNFAIPMRRAFALVGMISGLGVNTLIPTAYKAIISIKPLAETEDIRKMLTIDPKTFKVMKCKNMLFIPMDEDL